jgi:hypothetical protein
MLALYQIDTPAKASQEDQLRAVGRTLGRDQ